LQTAVTSSNSTLAANQATLTAASTVECKHC
jgi:hypothetical protein